MNPLDSENSKNNSEYENETDINQVPIPKGNDFRTMFLLSPYK